MMKKLVKSLGTTTITPDQIDECNIIALSGKVFDRDGKYVLVHDGEMYRFVSGNRFWDARQDKATLLASMLNDARCEIFVFDDIKEFAQWILK